MVKYQGLNNHSKQLWGAAIRQENRLLVLQKNMKAQKKEDLLQNDELHIRLRKNEKTLAISGFMVLVFGIWDVIRLILEFTLNTASIMKKIEAAGIFKDLQDLQDMFGFHDLGMTILIVFLLSIVAVSVIMSLSVRIIIWRASIKESRGEQTNAVYIVLSVIMLITNTVLIFVTSSRLGDYKYINFNMTEDEIIEAVLDYIISIPELTISIILSITSVVLFIELILSAIYVKRFRKKLAEYDLLTKEQDQG